VGAAAGAGLAYAGATPVLDALAESADPKCVLGKPSFPTGALAVAGRTAWTTDFRGTSITARPGPGRKRARSIDVGGAPVDIAISPGRRLALVTTAFYDHPGLALVDLRSGRVRRVEAADEPGAVGFAPGGDVAYLVSAGPKGTLSRVRARTGAIERTVRLGSHPRGLAITPDGERALVALNGDAALAVVELPEMRVHRIKVPAYPGDVAASPGGRRAFVSHDGLRSRKVSVVELRAHRVERTTKVGADASAIATSRSGAVVVTRSGQVVLLDAAGRRRRTMKLGGRLEAVAVAGGIAWVADGRTGELHRFRLGGLR
jgi:DNA-binding beta-propeller fold protein YncE